MRLAIVLTLTAAVLLLVAGVAGVRWGIHRQLERL